MKTKPKDKIQVNHPLFCIPAGGMCKNRRILKEHTTDSIGNVKTDNMVSVKPIVLCHLGRP